MQLNAEILTVDPVKEEPSTGGQYGPTWYVNGCFKDAGRFSASAKSLEKAKEIQVALAGLAGQPHQFEAHDNVREYNGQKSYMLKSWPGKPERPNFGFGGRGGGGGGFVPRYRDTKEGFAREQASIHRSVALQRAVEWLPREENITSYDVLGVADVFYGWLSIPQAVQIKAQQPEQAAPAQASASVPQKEMPPRPAAARTSRPPCPSCGKPEFVLQARDDSGNDKPGEYFCWKNAARGKLGCGHKWVEAKDIAAAHGMQMGSALTATAKYEQEIEKAVQAKDSGRLGKIALLIVQSVEGGSVSLDEAEHLQGLLQTAKKTLASGQEHSAWHDKKQAEAQKSLQELEDRF